MLDHPSPLLSLTHTHVGLPRDKWGLVHFTSHRPAPCSLHWYNLFNTLTLHECIFTLSYLHICILFLAGQKDVFLNSVIVVSRFLRINIACCFRQFHWPQLTGRWFTVQISVISQQPSQWLAPLMMCFRTINIFKDKQEVVRELHGNGNGKGQCQATKIMKFNRMWLFLLLD